jgi:HAE1 family hydrophobic/amphiphilic exporter-1
MGLADFSIRRPVFAVMLIAGLIGLGWNSISRVGVDLFPRVEYPFISVATILEGATPETVETEVTDILEEKLNTIAGIKSLRSTSSEGLSQVFLEFEIGQDINIKSQEVRDKIGMARGDIPIQAENPIVEKVDPDAEPILSILVVGDFSIRELTLYADNVVKEALQRVTGVGSVEIVGGRDREVRIWLDVDRLRGYGLSVQQVMQAIQSEHAEIPGGRLEAGGGETEFAVKTKGEVESVEAFGDIVVAFRDGRPTWLRDVARIEDGMEDERTYAELSGKRGVSLDVRRQSGENTVEVAKEVRKIVAQLQQSAPAGVQMVIARDVAHFVESAVNDVTSDMLMGGILAVLITFMFLMNPRSTLIVAVAIPTAIIATFFAFYVADFTLNMLTMMALSVSIGLLIDDAIVVVESIHRYVQEGEPPLRAATLGVRRVGSAVLAGMLAIVGVFVPIAFMEGLVGEFFFQYGLTVSFAVAVSFLVSMTLTPVLASRLLRKDPEKRTFARPFLAMHDWMERKYTAILQATLRHRWVAVLGLLVAVGAGGFFASLVPMEFMPQTDRSEFTANIELPLGTGLAETKRVAVRLAADIGQLDVVEEVFISIGAGVQNKVNEAEFYVALTPKQSRERGQFAIMDEVREVIRTRGPEVKSYTLAEIPWVSGGSAAGAQIEFLIQGQDLEYLGTVAESLADGMRASPAFADVSTSYDSGKPELQIQIDRRRAADLGVSVDRLASTVRALIGGVDISTYEEGGERYDVRVRLEENQRDDLAKLGLLQVNSATGALIDLDNVAKIEVGMAPVEIDRMDRSRSVSVSAGNSSGYTLGQSTEILNSLVAEIGLADGYSSRTEGTAKLMADTATSIVTAFGMALLVIYMILASQFNSFAQPAIIMLCAPLAFIGAFLAVYLEGAGLSLFAQIGLIVLMGLVMKNGILLVEYANQFREDGMDATSAILKAAPLRLRPILMTALSTIFGMLPVALSVSDGAEWRRPMGILVIGGLMSSTFLTLLIVPVVYTLTADMGRGLRRRFSALTSRAGPGQTKPAE